MKPLLKSTTAILIYIALCSLPIFLPGWAAATVQIIAIAITYDHLRQKWLETQKDKK